MLAYDLTGRPLAYGALNRTYVRNPRGQFAVNTKATDGFFPAAYAEAENPYPKLRATDDPLGLADDEFFDSRDHYRHLSDGYFDNGVKVASSRDTPAKYPTLPLGAWKLDSFEGIHGREIDQLRELDPNDLELAEAGDVESNQGGKGWDAERYLAWLQSGLAPPPVTVIETENGRLRLIDGHRRAWAAKQAGKPVRAWVSPLAPTGALDVNGRPIKAGMTRELLRKWIESRQREQYGRPAAPIRYAGEYDLSHLLTPGAGGRVGREKAEDLGDGTVLFRDPHGSHRFVRHVGGVPVSGLQVMSADGKRGHVVGVHTHPEHRRQGHASALLAAARSRFPELTFDEDRSAAGAAWVKAQEPEQYRRRPLPTRYAIQAPAGGVTIRGKRYLGGQFIPDEVLQAATDEERAAVAAGESRRKPLVPDQPTRFDGSR